MTELIGETEVRKAESMDAMNDLINLKKMEKKKVFTSIKKGNGALKENVKQGEKTTKKTVDPKKVKKSFGESAKFQA